LIQILCDRALGSTWSFNTISMMQHLSLFGTIPSRL
jgi:hypothetical protein